MKFLKCCPGVSKKIFLKLEIRSVPTDLILLLLFLLFIISRVLKLFFSPHNFSRFEHMRLGNKDLEQLGSALEKNTTINTLMYVKKHTLSLALFCFSLHLIFVTIHM